MSPRAKRQGAYLPGGINCRAQWLTITRNRDFERFVRAAGRKAEHPELPPVAASLHSDEIARLTAIAREHGIEICGPALT